MFPCIFIKERFVFLNESYSFYFGKKEIERDLCSCHGLSQSCSTYILCQVICNLSNVNCFRTNNILKKEIMVEQNTILKKLLESCIFYHTQLQCNSIEIHSTFNSDQAILWATTKKCTQLAQLRNDWIEDLINVKLAQL